MGHHRSESPAHSHNAPSSLHSHPDTTFLPGAAQWRSSPAVTLPWSSWYHHAVPSDWPSAMLLTGRFKCGRQFGKWRQRSVLGSLPASQWSATPKRNAQCTCRHIAVKRNVTMAPIPATTCSGRCSTCSGMTNCLCIKVPVQEFGSQTFSSFVDWC